MEPVNSSRQQITKREQSHVHTKTNLNEYMQALSISNEKVQLVNPQAAKIYAPTAKAGRPMA
jgi:hypothetical protein